MLDFFLENKRPCKYFKIMFSSFTCNIAFMQKKMISKNKQFNILVTSPYQN